MSGRKIVKRVEDGMDRQEIEATTYQMRNFYKQFHDGFFSHLDVFNYVQHHLIAVRYCREGDRVLDLCCGRGLMLPLLRYHAKPSQYVGVDIEPRNANFLHERVTDGKAIDPSYYPFAINFLNANVAEFADQIVGSFDLIIYTSSIEHMHPEAGMLSLIQARKVVKPGGRMIITTPNTPAGKDGYDTRYRAHVYEWSRMELREALQQTGWHVADEWGLTIGKRKLKQAAEKKGILPLIERLEPRLPNEWLCPLLAPLFPDEADEIAIHAVPE